MIVAYNYDGVSGRDQDLQQGRAGAVDEETEATNALKTALS
ncbi:MAG: hypothetical protein ABIH34_05820 [Nanoarchaeota archaeon]